MVWKNQFFSLKYSLKVLGIWLSITLFLLSFYFYIYFKDIFIISRQCDMSRNGTSAIYESLLFYSELLCEACHWAEASRSFNIPSWSGSALIETRSKGSFAEFQHTFLIRKRFVRNTFGTPVRPPRSLARDRGLRVARNTFLWVLLTHKNFTEDLRTLGKSLRVLPMTWTASLVFFVVLWILV